MVLFSFSINVLAKPTYNKATRIVFLFINKIENTKRTQFGLLIDQENELGKQNKSSHCETMNYYQMSE